MCLFKENIAIRYGVNAAIVAQFLWDNLDPQSNSGRLRFFSDEKWCRCSILMISAHLPFSDAQHGRKCTECACP